MGTHRPRAERIAALQAAARTQHENEMSFTRNMVRRMLKKNPTIKYSKIADLLNISRQRVHWHAVKLGAPRRRRNPVHLTGSAPEWHSYAESPFLFSRRETARLLGISLSTLDAVVKRGELKPRRINSCVLFSRTELERFAATAPESQPA